MSAQQAVAIQPTEFLGEGNTDAIIGMVGNAAFPRAARALAMNMLAAGAADETLANVFKDAGRYVTAMLVGYLDASGGMTLPKLKQFCAASGFLSPGRARMLLQFLLHIGYIDAARPDGTDRASAAEVYRATPLFFSAWRSHALAALRAAEILEPEVALLCDRLEEPGVFQSFLRVQAARLHEKARTAGQRPPFIRIFLDRYAGSQLVWTLIEAGDDSVFPATGAIPISLGATSRRFGVSHVHIRRLLNDAAREGMLRYEARGTVTFEEETRTILQLFYAAQLVELIITARTTLEMLRQAA